MPNPTPTEAKTIGELITTSTEKSETQGLVHIQTDTEAKYYDIIGERTALIGEIKMFFLSIPNDYIPMDGRYVNKVDYPKLETAIINGGRVSLFDFDMNPDQIGIPDWRGYFLRYQPVLEEGGVRDVGDLQDWAIENITGVLGARKLHGGGEYYLSESGALFSEDSATGPSGVNFTTSTTTKGEDIKFDASKVVKTGVETRPKNVNIIYAMRGR